MASFQKITIVVASLILIIILLSVTYTLKYSKSSIPIVIPKCPDYWNSDKNNNKEDICVNTKNLGTEPFIKTMNFNTPYFTSNSGQCNKYKWANLNKISWNGLTYGAKNPCI
jgi:hypothetical protein